MINTQIEIECDSGEGSERNLWYIYVISKWKITLANKSNKNKLSHLA